MNAGAMYAVICLAAMALVETYAWKANNELEHEKYELGKGKNTMLVTLFSFLSMFALLAMTFCIE